jgi:adenylate cyclase
MPTNMPSARLPRAVLVTALVIPGAIAAVLGFTSWTRVIEWRMSDIFMRATEAPDRADRSIVVALLDEKGTSAFSLAEDGEPEPWPWPRNAWGLLAKHLRSLGARAVILDLTFVQPSRREVRFEDDEFGAALKEVGGCYVTLTMLREREPQPETPKLLAAAKALREKLDARMAGNQAPAGVGAVYSDLLAPIAPLVESASGIGFVNVPPDADGILRRVPLVARCDDDVVPSLSLAVAKDLFGGGKFTLDAGHLTLGEHSIPLDGDGNLCLRPWGVGAYDRLGVGALMADAIKRMADDKAALTVGEEQVRGKIIVVGVSLSGLEDLVPTAVADSFLGPEVHAVALDHLKNGGALRPAGSTARTVLTVLLGAFAAALTLSKLKPWRAYALVVLALLALLAMVYFLLKGGWQLDGFTPALGLVLGAVTGGGVRAATEGRRNRWLDSTFKLYLSPAVIERLKKDPNRLNLGGKRREVTILFSDIAGFTSISEKLKPEDLAALLNQYLTAVTDTILDTGATLDKYIGDAVMAFFGDPIDQPDHADRALRVAAAHPRLIGALKPVLSHLGIEHFDVRIGIHTGDAVIGNFGSNKRFAYTAMGDNVNLASRLEGLNKYFGTHVLLTEETRRHVKSNEFRFREIGAIAVKGKEEPAHVFELVPDGIQIASAYTEGLALYRDGRIEEAARCFADPALTADGPSRFYRARISAILGGEHEKDEAGVLVMESK